MAAFHHGISAQEVVQGILPMRNANVSVIGLVVTSTDADADMYPLNVPVLLTGITQDNLDKAGADGTLFNCLQTIRDIHNPTVVILRVEEDFNPNILNVLLECPARFGLMPKRLGAPEIDTPDVVLKLVSIANRRRAMVYASPRKTDGILITDKAEIVAYRDTFGDRELCLIDGEWGVPGKADGSGGPGNPTTDFSILPINLSVTIKNTPLSLSGQFQSYFSVEVNGVTYNEDKSRHVAEIDDPSFWGLMEIQYLGDNEDISFTPLGDQILNIRLKPSESQKALSTEFLAGEGIVEPNGDFVFRLQNLAE